MKVAARQSAIAAGLPIIPGTDHAINTAEEALEFCESHGVPVIFKVNLAINYKTQMALQCFESIKICSSMDFYPRGKMSIKPCSEN